MALPEITQKVKLFFAILIIKTFDIEKIFSIIESNWGKIDYKSKLYNFDITDYYKDEMGENLYRFFVSVENLIKPYEIGTIKMMTNAIESAFLQKNKRPVNIDPGYMDYQKVVLASLKFGGQKIALFEGMYADMVLYYKKGSFITFPWTFPDFKTDKYYKDLLEIRTLYKKQLK